MEEFVKWVGPATALLIAIFGSVFTWLQIRQKRQEHKFKLYEERMKVYMALVALKENLLKTDEVTPDALGDFADEMTHGKLLFCPATRNLLEGVFKMAFEYQKSKLRLRDLQEGPDRDAVNKQQSETWLTICQQLIPNLFAVMDKEITPA